MPSSSSVALTGVAVIGIMGAFLPIVVHVVEAADPAIGCGLDVRRDFFELLWVADGFPGVLQHVAGVVAVTCIDEAHDAGETRLVFFAERHAHLISVHAEHRAPDEAFGRRAGKLQKLRLRRPVL